MGIRSATVSFALVASAACSTFDPTPLEQLDVQSRSQVRSHGDVTVWVAVLTDREARRGFDVWMHREKIQPVWLRIENRSERDYVFLMNNLDPEYFSSHETAWRNHFFLGGSHNEQMDDYMYDRKIRPFIPAGETAEGVVYTNRDAGVKVVGVDLLTEGELLQFDFVLEIPGLRADFLEVDFDALYEEDEIVDLDIPGLKQMLEELPCCALGGDRATDADPLNFAIVGSGNQLLAALANRGWHLTEKIHAGSVWGTVRSSVFGSEYKTSPISPLHLYGRAQDAGFQKARGTVDQRNHLRLWLAPYTFRGEEIWVGQISRDIGVKLSSKTFVTHEIDPQIDEARDYLMQDLLLSQAVQAVAWVEGVGPVDRDEPRRNYTNSEWFTDGWRLVLQLSDEPVPLTEVEFYDWEPPPAEWE